VVVAVIDTNVDTSISELQGQLAGTHDVIPGRPATDIDTDGHGTMVTSVIVARKDGVGMHGIAYEAKVLSVRADTTGSCQTTGENQGCRFSDATLINAINYAVTNGAKIINLSLGGDGPISTQLRNAIISATNRGVLFTIAAGNEGAAPTGTEAAKGLVPTEPAIVAGDPAVNGRVVAVGAVSASRFMPVFSNRAGQTQDYYILAPGVSNAIAGVDDNIRRPDLPTCSASVTTNCNDADTEGNYWLASGTSFAAPAVAGALALMLDLFPNMAPQDALMALLMTADDYVTTTPDPVLGVNAAVGVDPVGGRGILNLARAFAPIGTTTLTFEGEEPVDLGAALGPARGALGDWADASGAFNGLVYQDMFRRGYRITDTRMAAGRAPFADFGIRADYARGRARAFEMGPARMAWFNAPKAAYDPRMPWAEEPEATFQFSYTLGDARVAVGRGGGPERLTPGVMLINDPSGPPMLGAGDSWTSIAQAFGPVTIDARTSEGGGRAANSFGIGHVGEDWGVRLGYAALRDDTTALGGALQSRFGGEDETRMNAVSLEARRDVGLWRFSGAVEAADVRIDRRDVSGFDVSGLWTSSWTLSAEHPFAGGALRFSAAQPRRSEGGELAFSAPVEITRGGRLVYETRHATLTPSGRELDIEAAWSTFLGPMTSFEAAAALAMQPNHVRDADAEAAVWLSLRHAW